jgi:hypothetical protein
MDLVEANISEGATHTLLASIAEFLEVLEFDRTLAEFNVERRAKRKQLASSVSRSLRPKDGRSVTPRIVGHAATCCTACHKPAALQGQPDTQHCRPQRQ